MSVKYAQTSLAPWLPCHLLGLWMAFLSPAFSLADSWELPSPIENASSNFPITKLVQPGPFSMEATLELETLDGTAASIWIGREMNFGLDSRGERFFVEGTSIGKTVLLESNSDLIQPGIPFKFFAIRDKDDVLQMGINDTVIYSKPGFGGEIGEILFRPHRNRMTIHSIQLEGELAASPASRPAVIIHRQGDHHCHTFRIPGIARTNNGTLLAVYDMRYQSRRDLQGHMDIGLSRSTDGGQTWETPRPIMDMKEFGGLGQDQNGCSDPNILIDRQTGEIFVSAVWTHGKPGTHQWAGRGSEPGLDIHHSSQFMVVRSSDDGVTWSEPENWTRKLKNPDWYLFAPAPGNGIAMSNGTLVMPTQGRDAKGLPFSNIIWSKDHGQTWTVSSAARTNTTECAVAELSDGSLMLNMRDNRNRGDQSEKNGRAVSVTADLGSNWTRHVSDHGALPEPVCMASLISHVLPGGRRVLFFSNPNSKTARQNMTVRVSLEDGKTWPTHQQILLDHRGGAYSSLVMVDDDTLGILYESSRADLVFQTIELDELGL